ncbi:two component transcriptional regulator, LuxR family [Bryocella elongata]|uniref:Two component transcriptional regulator, LuxR family n=1 Tax=Bryocella elongata TaxID=863522 RepID=A0A1H5SNN1_9BACT|nr:response regulator transcription factor [Bryocella elongata]SEF52196.1 two component transcriptional regulator, LuxR family [Bryocella elongata]
MSNEPVRIRVLCVDDHPLMREGIAAVVRNEPDLMLVAEATTGREAIAAFRAHRPDITLMDLRLPDISGIDVVREIRADFPDARIVMLTTFDGDAEIQRSLEAGAQGYMLKNMPPKELVEMVRKVHQGRRYVPKEVAAQLAEHLGEEALSKREIEVLEKIADGNRNSDIAALLFISEETVKGHVKHVMEKLGASDRTAAVSIGLRRGIIRL